MRYGLTLSGNLRIHLLHLARENLLQLWSKTIRTRRFCPLPVSTPSAFAFTAFFEATTARAFPPYNTASEAMFRFSLEMKKAFPIKIVEREDKEATPALNAGQRNNEGRRF
jgi:hypothetical protein